MYPHRYGGRRFTTTSVDGREVELCRGGRKTELTLSNAARFVRLMFDYHLHEFDAAAAAVARGLATQVRGSSSTTTAAAATTTTRVNERERENERENRGRARPNSSWSVHSFLFCTYFRRWFSLISKVPATLVSINSHWYIPVSPPLLFAVQVPLSALRLFSPAQVEVMVTGRREVVLLPRRCLDSSITFNQEFT